MHIEAIVIRKQAIREHDQLVVLYSRELGKITAIAKGSLQRHSKQALALDDASHIQCELVDGKSGYIMTGTQALSSLGLAKQSPRTWSVAQVFLQAVDLMVFEAQADEELWGTLQEILQSLDRSSPETVLALYRRGQERFLQALGYGVAGSGEMLSRWARSALDEKFETIAQRRLSAIDVLYDVVATSAS